MSKTYLILPALLLLGACGPKIIPTIPAAPRCPDLPESVTAKQPPLAPIIDLSMGALVRDSIDLTARVGIAQNQRNTAIQMYGECQAAQDKYNLEVEKLQKEASKIKK